MKRMMNLSSAMALAVASTSVLAGQVDPALDELLDAAPADRHVSTLVYLADRVDTDGLIDTLNLQPTSMALRNQTVILELQDRAAATQGPLLEAIDAAMLRGDASNVQPFWLVNAVRVDATPAEIRALAKRDDVDTIFYNPPIELVDPTADAPAPGPGGLAGGGPEPGLDAINAPDAWAMGFDGTGRLVSSLDTGVAGSHPSLDSRWRGNDPDYAGNPGWAFFDPVTNWTFPQDSGTHGTHTMGTICGGLPGDQIGVAPGAEWIHAAVIDRVSIGQTVSDAILAFQWTVNPDGDPFTSFDVPDVSANSWGVATFHGYPECDDLFWSFLDACEAAGVVVVFAAGNEGFDGLRRPADRATDEYRTFAVAALDGNNGSLPIAGFSSRGPTQCGPNGESAVKPDIAAPGVNVRSAAPSGGYSLKSGTSMATPHIAGVVALMRHANPDLAPEEIKEIMYISAGDLGAPGEDNDYGHGIVNAATAVEIALSTVSVSFSYPDGRPDWVDPNGGTAIRVEVSGQSVQPLPGTGMLHYSTGGGFTSVPMVEVGTNVYDAVFPAFECGAHVNYYVTVEVEGGDVVANPFGAPDSTYAADAWSGVNTWFEDDFESDLGWTVVNDPGLATGAWERGTPVGGGDRGDPAQDADGSGQCFLTENEDGDSDLDGGGTLLTSPAMDASDPDAVLSYSRWYSNTAGADPMNDIMVIEISDDDGATWLPLETVGPGGPEVNGGWILREFLVADIPGVTNTDQLRVRFYAADLNAGSVVEAGVDNVRISALFCEETGVPGDLDGDGDVDAGDLATLLAAWGPCDGCPEDLDGDGAVGPGDLATLLANWG